jgi:hypothetical protein
MPITWTCRCGARTLLHLGYCASCGQKKPKPDPEPKPAPSLKSFVDTKQKD